jgi:hypothetical protein
MELINVETLYLLIGSWALIFIASAIAPKYGLEKVRRLFQIDGLAEGVRACAEQGKPMLYTIGMLYPDTTSIGRDIPGCMEVVKHISRQCADLNVRGYYTCANPTTHLMMMDYAMQGAIEAGHPERYRAEDIIYMGGGYAIILGTLGLMERQDPGAFLVWGNFWWGTHMPIMEAATRKGAFIVAGQSWTCEGVLGAFFTDLVAICEEQQAGGVYLSGDPVQGAAIFGEDLAKIIACGAIVVLAVLGLMGTPF